jgi:hypothetical protein
VFITLCIFKGRHVNLLQIGIRTSRRESQLNFLTFRWAHTKKFKYELSILTWSVRYIRILYKYTFYQQAFAQIIVDLSSMSVCYHHGMTSLRLRMETTHRYGETKEAIASSRQGVDLHFGNFTLLFYKQRAKQWLKHSKQITMDCLHM